MMTLVFCEKICILNKLTAIAEDKDRPTAPAVAANAVPRERTANKAMESTTQLPIKSRRRTNHLKL